MFRRLFKVNERFTTDKSIAIHGDRIKFDIEEFNFIVKFFPDEPSEKGNNFFNTERSQRKPKKGKKIIIKRQTKTRKEKKK